MMLVSRLFQERTNLLSGPHPKSIDLRQCH